MPSADTNGHSHGEDPSRKHQSNTRRGDPFEVTRSIKSVPVTEKRKPFFKNNSSNTLTHAGTARANIAPSFEHPHGSTDGDYSTKHSRQTVLQQHVDFFDPDKDGVIWPRDTFTGFRRLGYNLVLSLLAVFIIHANFSYPTGRSWIPDPFFRIHVRNIHRDKHGSDTGTYDNEGRFVPQKFEEIFTKYAGGRDYITVWDVYELMQGQRCIMDFVGWGGALFEWTATWIMLWPEDGKMMKEDIRGIYDGSIFYKIAERREREQKEICG